MFMTIPTSKLSRTDISDVEQWKTCLNDIRGKIMSSVQDLLLPLEIDDQIPLLLVDPAYHANIGDVVISYGELVLIERLGFKNHAECSIWCSVSMSPNCSAFENFKSGSGLAFFQGGGNWGDLWGFKSDLQKKRLKAFVDLTKKGYTVVGKLFLFYRKL